MIQQIVDAAREAGYPIDKETRDSIASVEDATQAVITSVISQLRIESLNPEGSAMVLRLKSHIFPFIVEALAGGFKENGGKNYLSMTVQHAELGPLDLTLQRKLGKTVSEVNSELRALLCQLLPYAEAHAWKSELLERVRAATNDFAPISAREQALTESLRELSEWMREHTGPSDGTLQILTKAVDLLNDPGAKP